MRRFSIFAGRAVEVSQLPFRSATHLVEQLIKPSGRNRTRREVGRRMSRGPIAVLFAWHILAQ